MSGYSAGLVTWKLFFQLSPIILTGGVMGNFPGQMLPIIAITESLNFPLGLLGGGDVGLDRFFANYQPLPGSGLIRQSAAMYPFANNTIAANAVITEPVQVSMLMICPAQNDFSAYTKLAIMTALRETLNLHNSLGGTYIIATPSYIYTNCVMVGMHDASTGLTKQVQNAYQLDFIRPLLTVEDAAQAQNGLFSLISSGAKVTNPVFSGLGAATQTPISLAGTGIVPAQLPTGAAVAAGPVANVPAVPSGPLGGGGV